MKGATFLLLVALGAISLAGCATEQANDSAARQSSPYLLSAANNSLFQEEPFIRQMNPPIDP